MSDSHPENILAKSSPHNAGASDAGQGESTLNAEATNDIRRGSPFRASSPAKASVPPPPAEILPTGLESSTLLEWGVLQASIWSSVMVLGFALVCYYVFPSGGTLVAAQGSVLALVGLFSSRPIISAMCLVSHAGLFFACYARVLAGSLIAALLTFSR